MAILNMKSTDPAGTGRGKEALHEHAGTEHDETCRCKEASKMTPGQLLRTMFNDLAFWKKTKKD
ncbi:MAG TPA: hypothetical protein VFK23_11820 [Nitrospirota bacterium]|nr:hypothetical protein [Nitrospirota bacterium]